MGTWYRRTGFEHDEVALLPSGSLMGESFSFAVLVIENAFLSNVVYI